MLSRSQHFVVHQHQWEGWLQTFFTIVLWISVLFLEVASFYALERIACSRVLLHLVLAFQLRGFPIDLCMPVPR
jgi:hypothetical protein